MASVSPTRLHGFIERFFFARRSVSHVVFDIVRNPVVARLAETVSQTPRNPDQAWVDRIELRGPEAVVRSIESNLVASPANTISAILVDDRCGLIRSFTLGALSKLKAAEIIAATLRSASDCQASGIILVSNDPHGVVTRGSECQQMTINLRHKGEAVEIFLLDHFIRTAGGWERMFPAKERGRIK